MSLATAFGYTRYSEGMKKITGFGMKNRLTLPSLGEKKFKSLKDESDEPIYTHKDKNLR